VLTVCVLCLRALMARQAARLIPNPPIGQICQKSARNWDDFRPFFTLRVFCVGCLVRILPYLRSGPGKMFIFFLNILLNIFLF
jgi:hypothetical protein